ncbi:MAG: GHMP kinase [Phycisphaeraceae bacterium]|nr:GHMP kinase [Phycisphaeraceae bacterium]
MTRAATCDSTVAAEGLLPPLSRLRAALSEAAIFAPGRVIAARAPGRLDVMGGVADYCGSLVAQMPLAEAAAVAVQSREDGMVVCHSRQLGQTARFPAAWLQLDDPHELRRQLGSDHAWAGYMIGCGWWLARHRGTSVGAATLMLDSDVPLGGGISSSAAVEVATMLAWSSLLNIKLSPMELAAACQTVENRIVGAPCGVMDQVASAMGRPGAMLKLLCQPDDAGLPAQLRGYVHLPAGFTVVGVHCGVRHEVAGDPYTDTRVAAFMAQRILFLRCPAHCRDRWLANVDVERFGSELASHLPAEMTGRAFLEQFHETADPVTTVKPDRTYHVRAAATHHVLEMARVRRFVVAIESASNSDAHHAM